MFLFSEDHTVHQDNFGLGELLDISIDGPQPTTLEKISEGDVIFKDYRYIHGKGFISTASINEEGVGIIPFDEFVSQLHFFPFGYPSNESIESLKKIFQQLGNSTIKIWEKIVPTHDLPIQSALHFYLFSLQATPEQEDILKEFILKNKFSGGNENIQQFDNFILTFLSCSEDIELGNTIIELINQGNSKDFFEAYADLVTLQNEIPEGDIDTTAFLKVIVGRGKEILQKGEITERSAVEIVKAGAFIKAFLVKNKSGEGMSMEEFNENPYFKLISFNGGSVFKKGIDIEELKMIDLISDDIYEKPEIFGGKDYQSLFDWIQENYRDLNVEEGNYLIKMIPTNLSNLNNIFHSIKYKKDNSLISSCRMNNGNFGGHYSSREFIGNFGIGGYLGNYAQKESKSEIIKFDAFINNNALELQINRGNVIMKGIYLFNYDTFESNYDVGSKKEEGISDYSVEMETLKKGVDYKSKDLKKYSDNAIIEASKNGVLDGFKVCCVNASNGDRKEYENTLKHFFSSGYVCTRFFYSKEGNNINKEKTYLVFELDKELLNISTNDTDEYFEEVD